MIRTNNPRILISMTIFLALLGCARPSPTPGDASASPEVPQTTSPHLAETPTLAIVEDEPLPDEAPGDSPQEAALIYHRSGGIAGIVETWTVYPDGRISEAQGGEWRSTPERVAALLQAIDDLGFFDMQASYLPKNTCCDRFLYELSVYKDGKSAKVSSLDGAEGTPEAFWQIIAQVQGFLEEKKQ